MRLEWEETWDDNDNSIWEAPSCLGSEDDGVFRHRVKPVLCDNRILWRLASDDELMSDDDQDEAFLSADAAKAYCQRRDEEIERAYEAKGGRG